jgi:hypothetical protein
MTTEELLRPRYKVINIWPDMDKMALCQGEIITLDKQFVNKQACIRIGDSALYDAFFDNYPHLFQHLEWWMERKPEDLPEYLQCPSRKTFCKVDKWDKGHFVTGGKTKMQMCNYIPATEADYNSWKDYMEEKGRDQPHPYL